MPTFVPQGYHLQVYQLSPPGPLPHPCVFWVRAYCQNQQVNHFVLTSTPDLSQFRITKDKVFMILCESNPGSSQPVRPLAASTRPLLPYAALHPTQRPTVTLISCHALGASLQGIRLVQFRLLRNPAAFQPSI